MEKAPRHIVDRSIKNIPHSGRFIVSSSAVRYLKKKKKCSKSTVIQITRVLIQLHFIIAPLYLLVVTYAVVKLFLHGAE